MSTEITHRHTRTELAEQMEFVRAATSEGRGQSILPDAYKDNPANALIAVGLGASMGLSPAESLYRISVIKGRPAAGAELIASNVRKAGHRLRVIGDETTCTATIIRADDPEFEFSVTRDMEWARQMGLAGNENYRKQPGTMLQWRAITAVARLACPEALYGVQYEPSELMESAPAQTSRRASVSDLQPAPATVEDAASIDAPAEVIEEPSEEPSEEPEPATRAQVTALNAAMTGLGITDRASKLAFLSDQVGHEIGSSKELTKREASFVLDVINGTGEETA